MVEYVGLRAVPVSALLLPTLLNAPSDLWGHGRANSLYLAINAVCVNFRDMRKPPQTALDTLGSRNSTENAVALRTAYGLPEAKMTSELAFADVFGLRENNQGPQHFWGAGVSTIFPLCKTDQEFRQFITKKCVGTGTGWLIRIEPVSDQCQTSVMPDAQPMSQSLYFSSMPSPCHRVACQICGVMSDAQKCPVGLPQCHFRTCTVLTEQ